MAKKQLNMQKKRKRLVTPQGILAIKIWRIIMANLNQEINRDVLKEVLRVDDDALFEAAIEILGLPAYATDYLVLDTG